MSRKDWIEVVGVISIVVTLGFVAMEIRQNTNAAQSAVYQSISEQSMDLIAMLVEDDELLAALDVVSAGGGNEQQRRIVYLYYAMALRLQQNRFLQSELGVVDRERMLFLGGRARLYRTEGFRAFWQVAREDLDEDFRIYVEEELMTLDAPAPLDPE